MIDAGSTGLDTRSGDLLTLIAKYLSTETDATLAKGIANLMHIVSHSDDILDIHDEGV